MTDIRTKGFESTAQLHEHLADLEDEVLVESSAAESDPEIAEQPDYLSARKEIAWLRKEVSDLRERLAVVGQQPHEAGLTSQAADHPWRRIALAMATTFVLGRIAQRLRLGAPGAAVVPLIAAQLDRRFRHSL